MMNRSQARDLALSSWDNEGGAAAAREVADGDQCDTASPALGNAELVQLRIRVIAMESLLIALLSKSSDRQLDLARDMASYISPRPGFTRHPMTINAAAQMRHLVGRAGHVRGMSLD